MHLIYIVGLLACSLAYKESVNSEGTQRRPNGGPPEAARGPMEAPTLPNSLRNRPLGKSGFEDIYTSLLTPMEFPVHYRTGQVEEPLTSNTKSFPMSRSMNPAANQLQRSNGSTPALTIPWFDISSALERNMVDPIRIPELRYTPPPVPRDTGPTGHNEFLNGSFFLKKEEPVNSINWTTCEEFGKKAYFHPQEVINIDWVPFYIWSTSRVTASIHRFTVPTKKVVEAFRSSQERFFNFTMDWSQPKLLLQERGKTDVLLVAVDRRGRFRALPWVAELEDSSVMVIRPMIVHLKIEASYLVYMHCNMRLTMIMAVLGTAPKTNKQKTKEADSIGFVGTGYPVRILGGSPNGQRLPPLLQAQRGQYQAPPEENRGAPLEYPVPPDARSQAKNASKRRKRTKRPLGWDRV